MSRQRAIDVLFIVAATCLGAWLRLRQLGVPSFWLDEMIHFDAATGAMKQPLWQWLAISALENGPLFYATQLIGRMVLPMEASARIAPALCGIAAIPLMWFAAKAAGGRAAAYAGTLLLAVSPLHVYYSREGRPYALVVVIAAAMLVVVLRGGSMRALIPLLLLAFYSTAIIAPFVFSIVVAALLTRQWRVATATTACLVLLALCYRPAIRTVQGAFPRVSTILDSFSVTGLDVTRMHWTAWAFAFLALFGGVILARRNAQHAIVIITVALLSVFIPVIAAWRLRPYFAVRYAIAALPAYLILVSIGVDWLFSSIPQQRLRGIMAAALLSVPAWNASLNEPFHKLDWRTIARAVATHAQPGDRILAAHHWSAYCLGFYLRGIAPQLPIIDAKGFPQAEPVTPTWIVVAQDPNGTFTPWACHFTIVLSSPIEMFHLHFAGASRTIPRIDEDSGPYVDETSVWRARGGRDLPAGFSAAPLARLLVRLGFNPKRAIPALTSHRVTLANLVSTVADNSDCEDDRTFLRQLFAEVLGREATKAELRDRAAQLEHGTSRSSMAWEMGDSNEVRVQLR